MRGIDQTVFLNQAEHELEEQLKEAIAVFQNLESHVLLTSASNGGWSIAACIDHLNSYASFYLPRLEQALEAAPDGVNTFKHSLMGQYFIRMMDSKRSKKKYKAMKIHQPHKVIDPYGVVADFIQHLERMLVLLKMARTKNLRKRVVPTSIAAFIKINAGDTFSFLLTHNRRHLEQAKRNLLKD